MQYWSDTKGIWIATRIKKVNIGNDGVVASYDCSGKPRADVTKVRPCPMDKILEKRKQKAEIDSQVSVPAEAAPAAVAAEAVPARKSSLRNARIAAPKAAPKATIKTGFLEKVKRTGPSKSVKLASAPQDIFVVGDRVKYWSDKQSKWIDTRIKAVNLGPAGVTSYNCSGKPKAEPWKLRRRMPSQAKTKPQDSAAPSGRTALAAAPVASQAAVSAAPARKAPKAAPAEEQFAVGQEVQYHSGSADKWLKATVVHIHPSKNGGGVLYDLNCKKGVKPSKLQAVSMPASKKQAASAQVAPEADASGGGAGLLFKNDIYGRKRPKLPVDPEEEKRRREERMKKWQEFNKNSEQAHT